MALILSWLEFITEGQDLNFKEGEGANVGVRERCLYAKHTSAKNHNFEQFPFFIFSPGVLKIEILASLNSQ